MQKIFALILLSPLGSFSQKISKDIRPDNHQVWLVTDDVDLNFRILQSGAIFAHFRTEGPEIFMYMSESFQLSPHDYAYFITDQDTVMIFSTGTQPGGWNGNNPYHEYQMTAETLAYLSLHPVKAVIVSHYGGWQSTSIPLKAQSKLQPYWAAVIKNMK